MRLCMRLLTHYRYTPLFAAISLIAAFCISGCGGKGAGAEKASTFTDSRDGQKYRTVKIGELVWMAENLNYKTGNSWCYDNDDSKCKQYGRLYDWETAKTACPAGWHLPYNKEWGNLITLVGEKAITTMTDEDEEGNIHEYTTDMTASELKSGNGWVDGDGNVSWNDNNHLGFSALPGGKRTVDGKFENLGKEGHWWGFFDGFDIIYGQKIANIVDIVANSNANSLYML